MTDTTVRAGASAPAAGPDFPAEFLGYFEPGSPEWHAARADGIGGSEIAAVLGVSPHESRFSLWHRKKGLVAPVEETDVMYWGKIHEPNICAEYAKRHPDQLVTTSGTYRALGRPWHIANPDRLLLPVCGCGLHRPNCCDPDDCGPCCEDCPTCPTQGVRPVEVLEAKTSRDDEGWGEEYTDQIPIHYKAQCRWYLAALGAPRCRVAVLIAGSEYREYMVEPDPVDTSLMLGQGQAFIESLRDDIRPDIDGHTATYQAIRELPEGLDDIDVEIPTALRDRFHTAQDAAWAADDELTACKGLLLDHIGTGRRAVCERERIATRTVRDGRTYQLLPARTRRTAR
ncbi:lambda-exonuclease family protein [Streptomyces sp. NPDC005970]|uniref:YqaJ viral recombinase family nuclease n=1 Tax=Streptomyces sp. NPDC005970 TaxID=3156723 RepID=UPI0033F9BC6D